MKLRTHVAIMANLLGLLFGITLWAMLSGLVYIGAILGVAMFIIGNAYGHYITKKIDSAIIEYMVSLMNMLMGKLNGN